MMFAVYLRKSQFGLKAVYQLKVYRGENVVYDDNVANIQGAIAEIKGFVPQDCVTSDPRKTFENLVEIQRNANSEGLKLYFADDDDVEYRLIDASWRKKPKSVSKPPKVWYY